MLLQSDLGLETPRLWTVRFSYQRYARCRGVMVRMQCKETRDFPGLDKKEAARNARDWLSNQFFDELLQKFGGTTEGIAAKITGEQTLIRPNSFNLLSIIDK